MLVARGNDALNVNPVDGANNALTTHGSDFYWAFFSLFAVATIGFAAFSFRKPRSDRVFYHLFAAVSAITAIAYFTMGADLGFTLIVTEYSQHQAAGTRQIFYARAIDQFLAFPLIVAAPLLLTDLLWSQIAFVLFAVDAAVIMRLIGSLITSMYKWGYFTFGLAAWIYVAVALLSSGRAGAVRNDAGFVYTITSSVIIFLGALYFLAWALSEGANVISLDSEAVFYGVLDLLFQTGLGVYFIWSVKNLALERFGLRESRNSIVETKSAAPRASDATVAADANVASQV